jgi:protein-disulfide isomerase
MRVVLLAALTAVAGCSSSSAGGGTAPRQQEGSLDAGLDALPPAVDVVVGDAPTEGPASARVTVIEFGDFECPYCGEEEPVVEQMLSAYEGRIRFVFKEFPLSSIHPYAELAAEAALAAQAQGKFWQYHDLLYANQSALGESDLEGYASMLGLDVTTFDLALQDHTYAAAVAADVAEGMSDGVDGTPTFFINGVMVVGAVPYSQLASVIDRELAATD